MFLAGGLNHLTAMSIAWLSFSLSVDSWYIAPPRVEKEWNQLSQLVVRCFDETLNQNDCIDDSKNESWMEKNWNEQYWNLIGKPRLEKITYRHFVSNARKLQGSKYTVLLAKDQGNVIGMIEVGVNSNNYTTTSSSYSTEIDDKLIGTDNMIRQRRPTIGLLCVDSKFRNQGVAKELVYRCEQIVSNIWKDDVIYAEVQPENFKAMSFFQSSLRYEPILVPLSTLSIRSDQETKQIRNSVSFSTGIDQTQSIATVMVELRQPQRIQTEKKMHILLSKTLS
jgi:ribosomal protein S18 acetylase RimI-like enzyme